LSIDFSFLTANLSAEGRGHKGAQSFAKIHSATALKARLITAMGTTHGIESVHHSPSRLQIPFGNKRQMREYEDE
jgi:hypothetical protein